MNGSNLTLSQFVENSRHYLTSETTLILSPGYHGLESELITENVCSFSMFVWPGSSSKAVITCHGQNARLEFSNISTVTVSGLEFVGCFESHVISVSRFQLDNSGFFGNGQAIVNGTVLSIEESVASLDRVAFISAVEKLQTSAAPQAPEECFARTIETADEVIGILMKHSNISITQSRFEGNKVGLGAVIYEEIDSDVMISNTVFANNSATQYCYSFCCFPGGIVYVSSQHRSTVKIYHSRFEENIGVAVIVSRHSMYTSEVSIIHSEFINNTVNDTQRIVITGIYQTGSLITLDRIMPTVSLNEFINNRVSRAIINMRYYNMDEYMTNNVFIDNGAAFGP